MNKMEYKNNITDGEIEKLWDEFEDVLFIEDEDCCDCCGLALASPWMYWDEGTSRDTIWRWFSQHYSKGLSGLLYGK